MKRLFGKRWHRLPVGIISAVLVICLIAGGAFAAYGFFTATAEVEVGEPFTFGVNYVGWDAPAGADMVAGYYSQSSPLTCSAAMMAGEVTHGNPIIEDEALRDSMPPLTIGDTPALGIPSAYHTFNSMQVANDAGLPITVSFAITGESANVYMVVWESPDLYTKLNGYTEEISGNGFIMRGIGVVAQEDAAPGAYTFTVTVSRG